MTDLPAGTYPLDPRRRLEDGAPFVVLRHLGFQRANVDSWDYLICDVSSTNVYPTAREALRAARVAAGLGDVGEQACDAFKDRRHMMRYSGIYPLCAECRWPRARHGE